MTLSTCTMQRRVNAFDVRRDRLNPLRRGFMAKRRARFAAAIASMALLAFTFSCVPVSRDERRTNESVWSPIVTDAVFSIDGKNVTLGIYDLKPGVAFFSPGISIRDGGALRVKAVHCRSVQVRHSVGGIHILDVSGTPGATRFSDIEVRVRCTVRKQMRATALNHGLNDCFDEKDEVFSNWLNSPAGDWQLQLPDKGWAVHSRWDYLRIQVQTRQLGSSVVSSMPTIVNGAVRLLPTEPRKRLAWMAAHSAIAALSDAGTCQTQ